MSEMAAERGEQELFDRESQIQTLLEAYGRCCTQATKTREVVAIVGHSGVGKTTLAEQLKKRVIQDFGYFVSGKLNEASRMFQTITECYNPIVVALSELCCQIAAAGEQRVQSFKTAAAQVMSSTELSLLQESIPTLEKIFGRNKKALTISGKGLSRGQDAESSFEHILRMFLFAGASERPLVLFLDDLHWASPKLVQILRSISSNPSPFTESRLMLLCAYRHDNEGYHRPFLPILDEIREDGATLTYVAVSSVSAHAVNQIVARELDVTIRETETLADVIHSKTGGNVLFAAIFFKSLLRDQLVAKDGSGRWHWDESQIIQEVEVISIQQFLIKTIDQLPPNARELLKVASCLGSAFTETMLWSAANMTRPNVESSLRLIERMGLVTTSATSGQTRFTHDKMREAADTLIAESERDSFHLGVGQRLLHWLPEDQQEDHLMLIVYQVSRGVHLLDDPEDKVAYSKLFLKAGRKAATLAEFSTASALVRTAVNLLGKRCWKDHYDQSLRLYNLLTEIEYYSGNLDQVDLLVAKTIKRSHNLNDAFVAHFTRIYSMGTRGCTEEALDEGLTHLTKMGFHLPHNPGLFRVARAFLRCQGMLRGQDDSDILNLPLMHDKSKLAAMRLLIVITGFAFYVREGLLPVTAFLLIKTTLKHGLNDMSCVGFACLCFIQAIRGDFRSANRFGNLALEIYKKYDAKEWEARVAVLVYGGVYAVNRPFRDCLEPLLSGHRSGLILGDIHMSMTSALLYVVIANGCAISLDRLAHETRSFREMCKRYRVDTVLTTLDATMQSMLNFMGCSKDPLTLTGEFLSEDEAMQDAKLNNPVTYGALLVCKHWLVVYFNDMVGSLEVSRKLRQVKLDKVLPFTVIEHKFLIGFAAARLSRSRESKKRQAHHILSQLRKHATVCPQNYQNKVYLMEAELSSSARCHEDAMAKYRLSIEFAREQHFHHEEGLAWEGAGLAMRDCERWEESREYFLQARSCYERWGAKAKVDHIDSFLNPAEN